MPVHAVHLNIKQWGGFDGACYYSVRIRTAAHIYTNLYLFSINEDWFYHSGNMYIHDPQLNELLKELKAKEMPAHMALAITEGNKTLAEAILMTPSG